MKNKILLLLIFSTAVLSLRGQTYRNPYSYYGIGEMGDRTTNASSSLGGIVAGWNNPFSFTFGNPASYSNVQTSVFDVSMKGKIQNLKQDTSNFTSSIISFGYLALGFPINNKIKWAGSLGISPISSIGYKNTYTTVIDSISKIETFENSGGFSRIYLGSSVQLFKKLNVGINLQYLFGNVEDKHILEFSGPTYNVNLLETRLKNYGRLMVEGGLQYMQKVGENKSLVIGLVYSPGMQVPANQKVIIQTFERYGSTIIYRDSIEKWERKSGELEYPMMGTIGFTLSQTLKWTIGMDYKFENWANYKTSENNGQLKNLHAISAGGELIPDITSIHYFDRIAYRFGLKYTSTYISIDNKTMTSAGISLGMGFPIVNKYYKTVISNINFGVSGNKYFNLPNNAINETYLNIYFGIRFNDIWFTQAKID